jgi:ketosteroid isomerase-like protein
MPAEEGNPNPYDPYATHYAGSAFDPNSDSALEDGEIDEAAQPQGLEDASNDDPGQAAVAGTEGTSEVLRPNRRRPIGQVADPEDGPGGKRRRNGDGETGGEDRLNDDTVMATGGTPQPANSVQPVGRTVQALQGQAAQQSERPSDDQYDFVRTDGYEGLREQGINPNFAAVMASEVEPGDIILVYAYDRVLGHQTIRDAQIEVKANIRDDNGTPRYGLIKSNATVFYGNDRLERYDVPPNQGIIHHTRPVIEKSRPMVIVRRTQGTLICLPMYTHGGQGLNGKEDFEIPDYVNVIDSRNDPEAQRALRLDKNLGIYASLKVTGTAYTPHPESCIKLTHPYAFSYGIGVKKVGKMEPACLKRLKIYAMLRAFSLNLADIGPPTDVVGRRIEEDEAKLNRVRINPRLTEVQIENLFHDRLRADADQFDVDFPQGQWRTRFVQNANSEGGLQAIITSAAEQYPGRPELQPRIDELRQAAGSVQGFRMPTNGTPLAGSDLLAILLAWKRIYRPRLRQFIRLGIYFEGKGPKLVDQNRQTPRRPATIWIYNNNMWEIFKRLGREPAANSNVQSSYWAMGPDRDAAQSTTHINDIIAAWRATVNADQGAALLNTGRDPTVQVLATTQVVPGPNPLQPAAQALADSLNDPQAWTTRAQEIVQAAVGLAAQLCVQLSERQRAELAARSANAAAGAATVVAAAANRGGLANAPNVPGPAGAGRGNQAPNPPQPPAQVQQMGMTNLALDSNAPDAQQ